MRRALIAVAIVLVAAPVAQGAIVPQHGIAGVRIGQTEQRVRELLGAPVQVVQYGNEFGTLRELRYPGLRVRMQGARRVTSMSTTRPSERTARGFGVGSTEAELVAGIRAIVCESFAGIRSCHVGALEPGGRVTDFRLRRGVVRRVTVGIVID